MTGGDYPRSTTAALLLAVQAAEDADPSGLTGLLLRVMAVLSPDGVPREMLNGLSNGRSGDLDVAAQLCAAGHRRVGRCLATW